MLDVDFDHKFTETFGGKSGWISDDESCSHQIGCVSLDDRV